MNAAESRKFSSLDVWTLVLLLAVTVWVRVWTLRTIGLGGDATFKWFFVRSWAYANPWAFDHHTMRFSINLPIWLVQKIFGTHPNGMYVAPLLAAIAQVPLLYGCGRALGAPAIGVIACLGLLIFEPMVDSASQLLPGIFQATYVLGALYTLLRFAREPEGGARWLAVAAVCLFLGYLAMVTTVYVLPGVALAVWFVRRRVRDVGWIIGTFAVLVALETIGYAIFSEYPFGQFQMILRTHTDVKPTGFWGLFGRYTALPFDWKVALASWCVGLIVWLALRWRTQFQGMRQTGAYALWLVPASALAGMTFGIKGIDPIIPATDFDPRYCDVLMPLVALGIAATLTWGFQLASGTRSIPRAELVVPLTAAAAILLTAWRASALYGPAGEHTLKITDDQWRALNDAVEKGLPIVGGNAGDHFQKKTLICIQWGYLEERHLLKDGHLDLHRMSKVEVRGRMRRYLAFRDMPPEAVAKSVKKRRCAVLATRREADPKLRLEVFPAENCESL